MRVCSPKRTKQKADRGYSQSQFSKERGGKIVSGRRKKRMEGVDACATEKLDGQWGMGCCTIKVAGNTRDLRVWPREGCVAKRMCGAREIGH